MNDERKWEPITSTVEVKKSGNSLCAVLTKECRMLSLKEGDIVQITIRRLTE